MMNETEAVLEYYSRHGSITDPGGLAGMFEGLPAGIPSLCAVVQGILLHTLWAERYGVTLSRHARKTSICGTCGECWRGYGNWTAAR